MRFKWTWEKIQELPQEEAFVWTRIKNLIWILVFRQEIRFETQCWMWLSWEYYTELRNVQILHGYFKLSIPDVPFV